jgi:hypothetical protein
VQALAEEQGVPASTQSRGWVVRQLGAEHADNADTAAMLDRLETDVRLVGSKLWRRITHGF